MDESLLLGRESLVVSRLCVDFFTKNGVAGIVNLLKNMTPTDKVFPDATYQMKVELRGKSSMSVDLDGADFTVTNSAAAFSVRDFHGQERLMASWRTADGVTKTGIVKSVVEPQNASFSLHVFREDLD
jgi:hypothetical protein